MLSYHKSIATTVYMYVSLVHKYTVLLLLKNNYTQRKNISHECNIVILYEHFMRNSKT